MTLTKQPFKNVEKGQNGVTHHFILSQQCFLSHKRIAISGFFLFKPLPDDKILEWSKLKQTVDDILKCI